MAATALIVSWNSAPDLRSCLPSLTTDTQVVVVDNGSDDDSILVAESHGATVFALDRNIGFSAAVNEGLESINTEYVLLLNPDVVVGEGAITRLEQELAGHPDVAIAGPNTLTSEGRAEPPAARHDRSAVQIFVESIGLVHLSRRFDLQMIHRRDADMDVDAVNGAVMLVRTRLLRDLGGLDESVFMYLEDQDLCRRVRDAGYRVRFVADAHAVHGNGTSTARGSEEQQARAYLHRIDADLEFLRRHGRRGEVGIAIAAFVVRCVFGLIVSIFGPGRRLRYRQALAYTVRQLRGRVPAPPV